LSALPTIEATEHHTLAEVAKRVPKAIFCLLTLREYRRLRKGTVDELWRQADRLRMTRVMRPYWDAMSS
jgi:hypothetical protein